MKDALSMSASMDPSFSKQLDKFCDSVVSLETNLCDHVLRGLFLGRRMGRDILAE